MTSSIKILFLFIALALTLSVLSQNRTKEMNAVEYNLVWQDNFDGIKLDETNNWNIEVNGNGGGNRELQYYRRENISVGVEPESGENCLIITGKKENFSGKTCTSGRLTTQNKMTFQYGKLEARIKLPKTANGLWPAFWLLGADIPIMDWPKCGEIDILEMGNADGIFMEKQDCYYNGACHWGFVENGTHPINVAAQAAPYSLQDDFHLYTMVWNTKVIQMYLDLDKYPDEKPYLQMGITSDATAKSPWYYFNKPFFVLFNLAIGGTYTQIFDINQVTALKNGDVKMYVDYVRLYQADDFGQKFTGQRVISNINETNYKPECRVYPNPFSDNLKFDTDNEIQFVKIYDVLGQEVLTESNLKSINTSTLPNGNYILKIEYSEGKSSIYKIRKQ